MLSEVRKFVVCGREFKTPMLVPSFSSKGFDDIMKIIKGAEEYVTEATLISAFDLYHKLIPKKGWTFPDLIFIDSGGYEFGIETDLNDHKLLDRKIDKKHWGPNQHRETLKSWNYTRPTVIISYDNPNLRQSYETQINRARKLSESFTGGASEILLKAEKKLDKSNHASGYIDIDRLRPHVDQLIGFDIIGVTEKELGRSLLDRLHTVHKLRTMLKNSGINTPLHIFGSLDPISTPLYFMAGADIFDGLTWLRFAYLDGIAIYRHNYAALEIQHSTIESTVMMNMHSHNHNYLLELNLQMQRFLNNQDFIVFDNHADLFRRFMDELKTRIGD